MDSVREHVASQAWETLLVNLDLLLEHSALRGPANGEINELRTKGWNPEAVQKIAENRAAEEQDQSARLDQFGSWRRGRLRDVMSARELRIEFQEMLPRTLFDHGLVFTDVFTDQLSARVFVRAMPSTEVSIELKTAWHRYRNKRWTANDIYDIDAMSVAVPYCDIVVTEKAYHHILQTANLRKRMHTLLLRDLEELPESLE